MNAQRLSAAFITSAVWIGCPALADVQIVKQPEQLANAFDAICVTPGASAEAQTTVATQTPWSLTPKGGIIGVYGRLHEGVPLQAVISTPPEPQSCSITTLLADPSTLEEVGNLIGASLSFKKAKIDTGRGRIDWPNALKDGRWVSFSVRPGPGSKVGILAAYNPKGN